MALPDFNMRQLLEAGAHFGHQAHRWNPKMKPFIFGVRNKIHIIDLAQTVPLLHQALVTVSDIVSGGGRVLFVGTKRQASEVIADAAKRCAQYYINHRWLGGTLTNWKTISHSIKRLRTLEELLAGEAQGLTKKELLQLTRERDKLERALGGIKDMGGIPNLLFVIDTNKESIAIAEARKLNIPVIAVVDSNCDPDGITYPIPGNDDAGRAINLFCDLIAKSAIDGIEKGQTSAGVDIGASENPVELTLDIPLEKEVAEKEPEAKEKPADTKKKKEPKAKDSKAKEAEAKEAEAKEAETKEAETKEAETKEADAKEADAKEDSKKEDNKSEPADYKGLAKPKGDPDDLKKITGVGPVLEKKLNDLGIFHYWQITDLSEDDIANIDNALNFKGRISRDNWLEQAAKLKEEVDA